MATETGVEEALTVTVPLGPRTYDVRIASGQFAGFGGFVKSALEATWAGRGSRKVLVVTDTNVRPQAEVFAGALKEVVGLSAELAEVPAGEGSKSFERAMELYDRLVNMRADRHTVILAVGGGVVGDLAGFVARRMRGGCPC